MEPETEAPKDYAWFTLENGEKVARTWANVDSGLIPWDEIDDDELSKARLRAGDGSWRHRPDAKLPRKLVPELTRRLKERYDDVLRAQLLELQQVHIEVALDRTAPPADRLRAAAYAQERLIGKVPDKVEVMAEVKPWEGLVEGVLTDVPDTSA